MKRMITVLAGSLALVAGLGLAGAAQDGGFCPFHERIGRLLGFGGMAPRLAPVLADRLDLTGEQKSAIAGILAANKDRVQPLVDAWLDAREAQAELVRPGQQDVEALRAACRAAAQAEEALLVEAVRAMNELAPVLTEVQRGELAVARPRAFSSLKAHLPLLRERLELWIEAHGG